MKATCVHKRQSGEVRSGVARRATHLDRGRQHDQTLPRFQTPGLLHRQGHERQACSSLQGVLRANYLLITEDLADIHSCGRPGR